MHSTIRAILSNEKYIGVWRWNATKWIRVPGRKARRQLERPESEHVIREYPELAIIDRRIWDRIQVRIAERKEKHTRDVPRSDQRVYLLSGLMRCGVCRGPMSVIGRQVKNGIEYTQFGCTAHVSRGNSICSNKTTISERKITEAFLDNMRTETLTVPYVMKQLTAAFENRVKEESSAPPAELEKQLKAAEARVANATRLMVEMPDDLGIRRQREADQAEVRRLSTALETQQGSTALPSEKEIASATRSLLAAITNAAPDRAREALGRAITPMFLTPKIVGPDHLVEVTGSLDLAPSFPGYRRSGGMTSPRACKLLVMFAFSIRRNGPTRYRSERRLVNRSPKK